MTFREFIEGCKNELCPRIPSIKEIKCKECYIRVYLTPNIQGMKDEA